MKKIFAAILCSLLLTGGIVAQAMAPMALGGSLNLSFNGTTAVCEASCRGDTSTDYVKATLTLYQGSSYIDSWSSEGTYRAIVSGQHGVTRGRSYTLKLNFGKTMVQPVAVGNGTFDRPLSSKNRLQAKNKQ